jgi:aspartate/methionine/tyrosine aminotransferase
MLVLAFRHPYILSPMTIETKLPKVGTTIFSVMSQLAVQHKAVNLGQGFPDFEPPQALRDALTRAMAEWAQSIRARHRHRGCASRSRENRAPVRS